MKRLIAGFIAGCFALGGLTVVSAQSANEGSATLECVGEFVDGGELECTVSDLVLTPPTSTTTTEVPPSTTTTTIAPTSSTSSSTTTTPPTTQSPPSSSAPSTTTTTPPSGVQFSEDFSTAAGFYDRFVTHVGNYCNADHTCRPEDIQDSIKNFNGDHNHACDNPTTLRNVSVSNHANLFWHCGGNVANGHMMVGLATSGYAITAFSPNQSFSNIQKVCWDVNTTDLGGGKWFNVVFVPEATYLAHPNLNPTAAAEGEGPYRLDYTSPGFNDDNAPGDFNIQGQNTQGLKLFRGVLSWWQNNASDSFTTADFTPVVTATEGADKATRRQHCVEDLNNGTLRITQARASGVDTSVIAGSLPNGPTRVIFQDDTYDSEKHDGIANHKTWHVDNIEIR